MVKSFKKENTKSLDTSSTWLVLLLFSSNLKSIHISGKKPIEFYDVHHGDSIESTLIIWLKVEFLVHVLVLELTKLCLYIHKHKYFRTWSFLWKDRLI